MKLKIIAFILLLLIGGVGIVGYSFTKITADVGETETTSYIERKVELLDFSYEGMISIVTPVNISNNAYLGLRDLQVNIKAYFKTDGLSEMFIGEGNNLLGDIEAGEFKSFDIVVNATEQIPVLAINDGTIRIEIVISVYAQFIPYEVVIPQEATVPWNHPVWL